MPARRLWTELRKSSSSRKRSKRSTRPGRVSISNSSPIRTQICFLCKYDCHVTILDRSARRDQVDDMITEALENDNLQLQNMSGGKYVQVGHLLKDSPNRVLSRSNRAMPSFWKSFRIGRRSSAQLTLCCPRGSTFKPNGRHWNPFSSDRPTSVYSFQKIRNGVMTSCITLSIAALDRFDGINADFQDLMKNAPDDTNVVEACNLEGRQVRCGSL